MLLLKRRRRYFGEEEDAGVLLSSPLGVHFVLQPGLHWFQAFCQRRVQVGALLCAVNRTGTESTDDGDGGDGDVRRLYCDSHTDQRKVDAVKNISDKDVRSSILSKYSLGGCSTSLSLLLSLSPSRSGHWRAATLVKMPRRCHQTSFLLVSAATIAASTAATLNSSVCGINANH